MAPPSTKIIAPVMRDAAGESTNAAAQPDSSGSLPAQRDVLRQAGTYLIGIATEGIKFTDPIGGS